MGRMYTVYIIYSIPITVETHKSLHHKSLRNFKSLRFVGDFR